MQSKAIAWVVLTLTCTILSRPISAANVNDFIDFSLRDENNAIVFPGRLHVPAEFSQDPSTPRPLILFLHGAGEAGTDNLKQINGNIDNLLAAAKQRGAFLYAPQNVGSFSNLSAHTQTLTMIDRVIAELNADSNRVYITGLSMGGGDVWYFVDQYPNSFAAGVPIAGGSPPFFLPTHLAGEPLWAFHARNDNVTPVENSRFVVSKILEGANEAVPSFPPLGDRTLLFQFDNPTLDLHYTEQPQGGHGIWGSVYQRDDMYDWLFAHTSVPEPTSFVLLGMAGIGLAMRRRLARPLV